MRAAIYCRVSTEDQEREGTSVVSGERFNLKDLASGANFHG